MHLYQMPGYYRYNQLESEEVEEFHVRATFRFIFGSSFFENEVKNEVEDTNLKDDPKTTE